MFNLSKDTTYYGLNFLNSHQKRETLMIDHATVERIIDASNIVEVVSDFVTLRKRGVNYVGLCPFHEEKTPSFSVSPTRGICKCFSCGKGGNAVNFIMEHEQMSYVEALRYLAKKYNIEIKERELTHEEKQAQSERESLFITNQFASEYFQNILHHHVDGKAIGMSYFRQRGFRDDIIKKFQLGFSTTQRDGLYQEALKKGFKKTFLEKTGLCYVTERGAYKDRFWGRVIFPVHTLSGKVVAFGGRILNTDAKAAKYVNSPESDIYHKSNELYGIYFGKKSIIKEDRCYLVEGYTDVISMHQSGIENVVASSGTALTTGQIKMIHRLTENITILYDGDAAGIKASLRGIDMLLEEGMNIKILLLPEGEDPDSFAKAHSSEDFQNYINEHQTDFIKFKTNLLLEEAGDDPIKRSSLITDIVRSIAVIPRVIVRDVYINECSQMMNIDGKTLLNEVIKIRRNKREKEVEQKERENRLGAQQPASTTAPTAPQNTTAPLRTKAQLRDNEVYQREKSIIRMLIRYGEQEMYRGIDEEGKEEILYVGQFIFDSMQEDELEFQDTLWKKMAYIIEQHLAQSNTSVQRYLMGYPEDEIRTKATELANDRYELSRLYENEKTLIDVANRLHEIVPHIMIDYKATILTKEIKEVTELLRKPEVIQNETLAMETLKRYQELKEILNEIAKRQGDRAILPL